MKLLFLISVYLLGNFIYDQNYKKVVETDTTVIYEVDRNTINIAKPINSSVKGVRYLEVVQTAYYKGNLTEKINQLKKYPVDALRNKIEGTVKLHCKVDSSGNLYGPIVLYSVYPSIDKEALRIVKLLPKFEPSILADGTKVESVVRIEVPFQL